jgi:hypothetical protein
MKIYLTLVCVLSLSACGVQQNQNTPVQTREGYCPDCGKAWLSASRGTTWTVLRQQDNLGSNSEPIIVVGADAQTDPLLGDTDLDVALPILCLEPLVVPNRFGTLDQFNSPINARVATSATKSGSQARWLSASDFICQEQFGNGWRMAHDTDAPDLNVLVAYGQIAPYARFWVAIDKKPTSPIQ